MTKADIIEWVAQRSDIPKKQAEMVVNTVLLSIVEALDAGEKVELRGFGSFHMKKREARVARNPKTGEKVHVDEKKIPYFRAGKELKELINK
ncbi:MAG: integration host factor subunit beta [Acidobacteria bacterium]|jgi:integration host factor subunit beta|nr:integration host factor subunit beta [Acidobacteriota bacterium]